MRIPDVNELIGIGRKVIEKARDLGADEVEVYLSASDIFSIRVITNYVVTKSGLDAGAGIRVVVGKKVGFASISSIEYDKIIDAVKEAIKIAKTRPEDPDFKHLPDPKRTAGKAGIYDEALEETPISTLIKMIEKSVKEGFKLGDFIKKIDFSFNRTIGTFAVVNSRGIEVGDKYTRVSSWASVKAEKDGDIVTGSYYYAGRKLESEEIENLGTKAGKRAIRMFGGKRLEKAIKGQMAVENLVVSDFLWPITFNVAANNVQEGRSRFAGKSNEEVAAKKVTIYDDGTLPEGIRTAIIDDEGIPMSKKPLIEKGVLKAYVYDSYTALKEGKESTGNAFRRNYETAPVPFITNLVIKETSRANINDLILKIDKGVYISGFTMGSHLTDPIKGTFSITSLNAFYVENGEIKCPLKSVSASGNFFELLRNIIEVGSDYKITYYGKIPSILVDGVSFI